MNGATMSLQSAGIVAGPPIAMVAAGFTDWQVLAVLTIALLVGIYRVVLSDPPMPMRLAIVTTVTGFAVTVCIAPVFGKFIANRLGVDHAEGAILAAFIIAIGWTKAYKMVENSLVDTLLQAIVRGFKAFLGGK
jgi:hypothetical protein